MCVDGSRPRRKAVTATEMRLLNDSERGERRSGLTVWFPNSSGYGNRGDEYFSFSRYPFSRGPQPL